MPVLKKGSKGPAVKQLQEQLYRFGYDPGTVDGIFGPKTEKAVKAFQRANDLDVDGIVGEFTWMALEAAQPFTGEVTPVA